MEIKVIIIPIKFFNVILLFSCHYDRIREKMFAVQKYKVNFISFSSSFSAFKK